MQPSYEPPKPPPEKILPNTPLVFSDKEYTFESSLEKWFFLEFLTTLYPGKPKDYDSNNNKYHLVY